MEWVSGLGEVLATDFADYTDGEGEVIFYGGVVDWMGAEWNENAVGSSGTKWGGGVFSFAIKEI